MCDGLKKQKSADLRPVQRTQMLNLMIWGICKFQNNFGLLKSINFI